jgi:hypothetical protein
MITIFLKPKVSSKFYQTGSILYQKPPICSTNIFLNLKIGPCKKGNKMEPLVVLTWNHLSVIYARGTMLQNKN